MIRFTLLFACVWPVCAFTAVSGAESRNVPEKTLHRRMSS